MESSTTLFVVQCEFRQFNQVDYDVCFNEVTTTFGNCIWNGYETRNSGVSAHLQGHERLIYITQIHWFTDSSRTGIIRVYEYLPITKLRGNCLHHVTRVSNQTNHSICSIVWQTHVLCSSVDSVCFRLGRVNLIDFKLAVSFFIKIRSHEPYGVSK